MPHPLSIFVLIIRYLPNLFKAQSKTERPGKQRSLHSRFEYLRVYHNYNTDLVLNYITHDYQSFRGFTIMGFSNQLTMLLVSTLSATNLISINVKCEVVSDSPGRHEISGEINLLDNDNWKIKKFLSNLRIQFFIGYFLCLQ